MARLRQTLGGRSGGPLTHRSYTTPWDTTATTTEAGLKVYCELDTNAYPKGITLSDEDMDAINITRAEFHGEWNYTIRPGNRTDRAVDS